MTISSPKPTSEFPLVFTGLNSLNASIWALAPIFYFLPFLLAPNIPVLLGLIGLNIFFAFGERYRCEVDTTGIYLVRRVCYFLPIKRYNFGLDAEPGYYEPWASDRSEGVVLSSRWPTWQESDIFGPHFSLRAQQRLHDALAAAIHRARALCPPAPPQIRYAPLNRYNHRIEVLTRCADGRPKTARTTEPVPLLGMQIPVDSTLHFESGWFNAWRDPRQEDILHAIDCADTITLPWGQRTELPPRLSFRETDGSFGLEGAFDRPIHLGGRWVDGQELLYFDLDAKLLQYTLAEPVTIARLGIFAPGSQVCHQRGWGGQKTVCITPPGPMRILGYTYRADKAVHLQAPWHLSRYTFGLWRPSIGLESYRLDRAHHNTLRMLERVASNESPHEY